MSESDHSAASGKKPANIHDDFFKDVFKERKYVTSLIRVGAPKALFEIIDWDSLRLESQWIKADRQKEKLADLVFSATLKDSERTARIVLLFEHKSYRDDALDKQMVRNQFLMYLQNDFQVPIVVFQGPWFKHRSVTFSNLFSDYSEQHLRILTEYSVNFRCLLINVNEIDRQGLAEKTNIDAVVRAMSTVRDFDVSDLQDLMDRTRHVPAKDRARMFKLVLGYVCDYNNAIKQDDILKLETKTPEEKQMVLSAVEAFREEGRAEGRQEGREEGLEKGLEKGRQEFVAYLLQKGMGPEEIVDATKLSREQVESLQQKINGTS